MTAPFELKMTEQQAYDGLKKQFGTEFTAPEVRAFLDSKPLVKEMFTDIVRLLENWLPHFDKARRHYITVAVGCTGWRHRSVYMTERLAKHFRMQYDHIMVRHRDNSDAA